MSKDTSSELLNLVSDSANPTGQILLASIALLLLYYIVSHLRPLTSAEIAELATKRRSASVKAYFAFRATRQPLDVAFKQGMRADGRLHRVEYPLWNAPAIIASHLKYKKHEWIVFAFEKDRMITMLWTNKGPDGTKVRPFISHDRACGIARQNQCSSLLRLHNHPNPDPRRFRMLGASEQDTLSSGHLANECREHGLNFADVVCERGFFHVFRFDAHESFMPVADFESRVHAENGRSRYRNLRLHVERHF